MSAEIKPDLRQFINVAIVAASLLVCIAGGHYLFQVRQAWAAESLYHHLDREWPRENSLVYVPYGLDGCLHLARFDAKVGFFYDEQGWIPVDKWLYFLDRRPPETEFCTTED